MADESQQIGQDEIEQLLQQAQQAKQAQDSPSDADTPSKSLDKDEIESLLNESGGSANQQTSPAGALNQEDIDELLGSKSPANAGTKAPSETRPASQPQSDGVSQADLDLLLDQAEAALASVDAPGDTVRSASSAGALPFELADFTGAPPSTEGATLELVRDVELDVKIELGRTNMYLQDILRLGKGSVVPLDKLAGDPVDIYVNGRLIARGEVLVLNDNFCVRVAELVVGESAVA